MNDENLRWYCPDEARGKRAGEIAKIVEDKIGDNKNETQTMIEHILKQYEKDWTKFPQIMMQVFSANSFLFTLVMDIKQNSSSGLKKLGSLIYQCVKKCSVRKFSHFDEHTPFYFKENSVPTQVYSCLNWTPDIISKVLKQGQFIIPGLLSANVQENYALKYC